MKNIYAILTGLFITINMTVAGNGNNPPCNCTNTDQADLYAAGTAIWVDSFQIRCDGDIGTCWSLTYAGKYILTIYTQPPIIFDNHNPPSDPPLEPQVKHKDTDYTIYSIDPNTWTQQ